MAYITRAEFRKNVIPLKFKHLVHIKSKGYPFYKFCDQKHFTVFPILYVYVSVKAYIVNPIIYLLDAVKGKPIGLT